MDARFFLCASCVLITAVIVTPGTPGNTPPTTPGRTTEKESLVSEDKTTLESSGGPPETETPETGTSWEA